VPLSRAAVDDIIAKSAGTTSKLEDSTVAELAEASGIPLDDLKKQHEDAYNGALDDYDVPPGPITG